MDGDTRGLGSRAEHDGAHPTRRLLVVGGAAAALAVLVARGLRIDTPPPAPPVPTRRRAPDEKVLLGSLGDVERIAKAQADVVSTTDDALVGRLLTLSRQQARVLRGRLTNAGVPTSVIDSAVAAAATNGPTASGAQPSATPSGETVRSPATLARLLLDTLTPGGWQALAAAETDTRELLTAAWAQRLAAVLLLGGELPAPAASPVRPNLAARTEALAYAFEVVAAQSTGPQRHTAEGTLARLVRLEDAVSAAGVTVPAGWALPYPVTTPQQARRLATDMLSSAVKEAAALTRSDAGATSLEDTARWSAHVQAVGLDWGLPLTAFPGAST